MLIWLISETSFIYYDDSDRRLSLHTENWIWGQTISKWCIRQKFSHHMRTLTSRKDWLVVKTLITSWDWFTCTHFCSILHNPLSGRVLCHNNSWDYLFSKHFVYADLCTIVCCSSCTSVFVRFFSQKLMLAILCYCCSCNTPYQIICKGNQILLQTCVQYSLIGL